MGSYYCHICGTYGESQDGCEEDKNGDTCHEHCKEVEDEQQNERGKDEAEKEATSVETGYQYPKRSSKNKDLGQKEDGTDL